MEMRFSVNRRVMLPGGVSAFGPSNFSTTHSPSSFGAGLAASLGAGAATARARPMIRLLFMGCLSERTAKYTAIRGGWGLLSQPAPGMGIRLRILHDSREIRMFQIPGEDLAPPNCPVAPGDPGDRGGQARDFCHRLA